MSLSMEAMRTVWIASAATGLQQKSETDVSIALSNPYKSSHIARIFHTQDIRQVSVKEVEVGVTIHYGIEKTTNKEEPFLFQFDAAKFTEGEAKIWLGQHSARVYHFEPAAQPTGPLQTQPGEGIERQPDNISNALDEESKLRSAGSGGAVGAVFTTNASASMEGVTMPWTAADVPKHNKSIKDEKTKEKWAAMASAILASSIKDGKSQEDSERVAIATANKQYGRSEEEESEEDDKEENKKKEEERCSRFDNGDLCVRMITLMPETCDEDTRSVEAVIATEAPAFSTDIRTKKAVHEVWRMDGMECDDNVPVLDNHNRESVHCMLGSVRSIRDYTTDDGYAAKKGRLHISEAEPEIWQKVKDGTIREVSAGVWPMETETIPPGQVRSIRGASYCARSDQPLHVRTKTKLREVSLTPKAADHRTQIRSLTQEKQKMHEKTLKYLFSIGLKQGTNEEESTTFYKSLPETTRALADAAATVPDPEPVKVVAKTADPPAPVDEEKIRKDAAECERKRQTEIRRLGEGLGEETVRKAIDEGWPIEKAAPLFLDEMRTRSASARPGTHSRSFDKDVSAEVLGAAMTIRSLNELSSDKPGKHANPLDVFGGYVPANPDGTFRKESCDWVHRRSFDPDTRRKAAAVLLERAERFSGLGMLDICRMACRLDGIQLSGFDPGETIRSAGSGGALAAIFTTNFNAQFLAGYLDAVDTTQGWCTESDVPNFMPAERATIGKMGGLRRQTPNQPAEHMDISDWNEILTVQRYTGQFKIDEKDIINDRFGALEQVSPQEMGLSARQLRPNLVYSMLLNNPTLNQDGIAIFDTATHANYVATLASRLCDTSDVTGPVYAQPLQTAISAIGSQRIRNRPLNLFPRYLIVPPTMRWAAAVLLQSAERMIATGSGGTFNPLRDLGIEPRVETRINATGCPDPTADNALVAGSNTAWYLMCQPGEQGAKTVEVGYLRGTGRAPQIRSFVMDKGEWGIGWDVKLDIGVVPLDFRGMYKATGAAP